MPLRDALLPLLVLVALGRPAAALPLALPARHGAGPRAAVPAADRPAGITVQFALLPNLTYQLDCVAGVVSQCGTAGFTALWRARFLRTPADSAALAAWRDSRGRYSGALAVTAGASAPGAPATDVAPYPIVGPTLGLDVSERVRLAGFRSRTRGGGRRAIAGLARFALNLRGRAL